ncbi:hypothetical protein ZWY2020_028390 [Hordeum vulgare]|nr:hypothetical protein ZWY2020_028390 [Hordeum vulgare]
MVIKWGGLLIRLFKKHAERLSFDVQWRPLYKTLIQTHFKKNMGPEGWKVRQQHFETITSLVRASRTFFPEGAATEIWLKFSTNVCYLQAMCTSSAAFSRISELPMVLPEDPAIKKLGTATWTSHLYMMDAVQVSTVMESAEISHCVLGLQMRFPRLFLVALPLFMDRFEPVSHLHFLNGDGYCCTAHVDTKERSSGYCKLGLRDVYI